MNYLERGNMNKYFNGWLDYHIKQRHKWTDLVKYKYIINRNKLNKVVCAWKLLIRENKLYRLKENLIAFSV